MGDLVKYLARSAVALHGRFKRQGMLTRQRGASAKRDIVDGYIASTVVSGDTSVTTVIDLPANIVWFSREFTGSPSAWFFAVCAPLGFRDTYKPGTTPISASVAIDNAKKISPGSYSYVAPDYDAATTGAGRTHFHGLPTVCGDWVYGTPQYRTLIPDSGPFAFDDFVVNVFGASWAAPTAPLTDNALVQTDGEAPGLRGSTRVVCVPAKSIAQAAGATGIRIVQNPNNAFMASIEVRESGDPVVTSIYVAVGGRDMSDVDAQVPVLLVGKVTLAAEQELPLDWGVRRFMAAGTNIMDAIGLYVGSIVTAVAVDGDGTRMVTIDSGSGAVLSDDLIAEHPYYIYPICSTSTGLWVARAYVDVGVIVDCALHRIVDGVMSGPADLGGWWPLCVLLPSLPTVISVGAMAPVVIELGGGRIGVAACAPGGFHVGTTIPWYLLEVDAVTLAVVGARGLLGYASPSGLTNFIPRPIAVTVVTPQVVVDGVVTTPAVLLKGVQGATFLSNDGGYTWQVVDTTIGGYPYYFGNGLHPFTPNETL